MLVAFILVCAMASIAQDISPQTLKLQELEAKIQKGIFIPGKTSAEFIRPWLGKEQEWKVRMLAFQCLNLHASDGIELVKEILKTKEPELVTLACERLWLVLGNASIPILMEALPKASLQNQTVILEKLVQIRVPAIVPILVGKYLALAHKNVFDKTGMSVHEIERREFGKLAALLWQFPLETLKLHFQNLLYDKNPYIRLASLKVLYKESNPDAIQSLLPFMRQSNTPWKQLIWDEIILAHYPDEVMGRRVPIKEPLVFQEVLTWLFHPAFKENDSLIRLVGASITVSPAHIDSLKPYLKNPQQRLLLLPLFQLHETIPVELVDDVVPLLHHPQPEVLAQVLIILRSQAQTLPLARIHLTHPALDVRKAALQVIDHLKPTDHRQLLLQVLATDSDMQIRQSALATLLDQYPEPDTVRTAFRQLVQFSDAQWAMMPEYMLMSQHLPALEELEPLLARSPHIQQLMLENFRLQHYIPSMTYLTPLLKSSDPGVVVEALRFLANASPRADEVAALIKPYFRTNQNGGAVAAWCGLRGMPLEKWQAPLLELLKVGTPDDSNIIGCLLQRNSPQAVTSLIDFLTTQNTQPDLAQHPSLHNIARMAEPAKLLPLLGHPSAYVRRDILEWLQRHGNTDLVPAIQQQLPHLSSQGQAGALILLGELGSRSVASTVLPYLKHQDISIRLAALEALGNLRHPAVLREAQTFLEAEPEEWQKTALTALAATRFPDATALILPALHSPRSQVRKTALVALRSLKARSGLPQITETLGDRILQDRRSGCFGFPERSEAVRHIIDLATPANLDILLTQIEPADFQGLDPLSMPTSTGMGKLAYQVLPKNLVPYLSDSRPQLRELVVKTLGELPDPAFVPALQQAWQQETDPDVRHTLEETLGVYQEKSVIPALQKRLKADEYYAAKLLMAMHDRETKLWLLQQVMPPFQQNKHTQWRVDLLADYMDEEIRLGFQKLLSHPNSQVRQKIQLALKADVPAPQLAHMGYQSIVTSSQVWLPDTFEAQLNYLSRLSAELAAQCFMSLVELAQTPQQRQQAFHFIMGYLGTPDASVVSKAIGALRQLKDPAAIPHVLPFLLDNHDSPLVRDILRQLKMSADYPQLLAIFNQMPAEDAGDLHLFRLQLLWEQGHKQRVLDELKSLRLSPAFVNHPYLYVKATHWQSDLLPAAERLSLLSTVPAYIHQNFTAHDERHYSSAMLATWLRQGIAYLQTDHPEDAFPLIQQAFEDSFVGPRDYGNPMRQGSFSALLQFLIAETQLATHQPTAAIEHMIHGLRFIHESKDWKTAAMTEWGGQLPYQTDYQSQYQRLLELLDKYDTSRRKEFFRLYFSKNDRWSNY